MSRRQRHGPMTHGAATPARFQIAPLLKSMRIHQWVKNGLVFVPIVLSGKLTEFGALTDTAIAFLALCILASGTYVLNDIRDLPDDRKHGSKRNRPLASGQLSITIAAVFVPVAAVVALGLGAFASSDVVAVLVAYLCLTLLYTFKLKQFALLDCFVLAVLYTLRLVLGAVAADASWSSWLLVFSMFMFMSLSLAKRHAEIMNVTMNDGVALDGRGYSNVDAPVLLALGVSSGAGAVLIMVLYIVEDAFRQSFYGDTVWLWGFPPLLFLFISRIWLICQRGQMSDDPVAFALKDRFSLGLLACLIVCFGIAWFGPQWYR